MRILRFILLLTTLLVVYFAQHIFDTGSLAQFFPDWFLARFSFAVRLTRWQPSDLLLLGWGAAALAAIFFGLITPAWPSHKGLTYITPTTKRSSSLTTGFAVLAIVLAVLCATYVIAGIGSPSGSLPEQLAWLLSWVFALMTGILLNRPSSLQVRSVGSSNPEKSWLIFLFLLAGAAFIFSFRFLEVPPSIDVQVANYALQAKTMLVSANSGIEEFNLLAVGATGRTYLTTLITALTIRLTGDALLGMRVAGILAGLLTVTGTWLAGCEIFRRMARKDRNEDLLEDDGRFPALLGACVVAGSVVAMHFSRIPVFLEPVAWGTLGLWALLRGTRRADALGLVLAGFLGGLAAVVHPSGFAFLLLMATYLFANWIIPGISLPRISLARRWGWALWLFAVVCVMSPMLRVWFWNPEAFWSDFIGMDGSVLSSALNNLLSILWRADRSALFGYPGHMLDSVLAPLFLLAVGGLLLNLDRLPGWILTTWLAWSAIVGATLVSQTPSWPEFLPVLPAAALAVGYAIDRIRSTLIESAGRWLTQATVYMGIGIVLWATLANWVDYVHFIDTRRDAASEIITTILRDKDKNYLLVDTDDGQTPSLEHPVLRLLSNGIESNPAYQSTLFTQLPATLTPGTTMLIVPQGQQALQAATQQYPQGKLTTKRDQRGNPTLYLYKIP